MMETWMKVYSKCLEQRLIEDAAKPAYERNYAYNLSEMPKVLEKMRASFKQGSYNKEGGAIKAACKTLKIPYTYKAINHFIANHV